MELAGATGRAAEVRALLLLHYEQSHSLDLLEGIVALDAAAGGAQGPARDWYVRHLEKEASLVAAAKWLANEPFTTRNSTRRCSALSTPPRSR